MEAFREKSKHLNRLSRRYPGKSTQVDSPASESVNNLLDKCEDYKTYIADFNTRMRRESRSAQSLIEEGKRTADCLVSFTQKVTSAEADSELVDLVLKSRDFQLNYVDHFTKLHSSLGEKVPNGLSDGTHQSFAAVKVAKKNFQKAKSNYEVSLANSGKKKGAPDPAAQEKVKELYFESGNTTLFALQDAIKEVELALLKSFCDYWDSYYDFHTKNSKWLINTRTVIEAKREHWKKQTAKFKDEKVNRSGTNSFKQAANSKIFGVSLAELAARTEGEVPEFVDRIIKHLSTVGPTLEGIFRISAMRSALMTFQEKVDTESNVNFHDVNDQHIIAALFKQFLREIPEPLLTFELYSNFIDANSIEDDGERLEELKRLVKKLPRVNRLVLKKVLFMLATISDNEDVCKMGPTNLSTVIGPNILYGKEINPLTMVEDMESANSIIVTMISKAHQIFIIESPLEAAREDNLPVLRSLYHEGKDFTEKDENGRTVLHHCCKNGNYKMIEFLVSLDPIPFNIDQQDTLKGETALMYLCKEESLNTQVMAQILSKAGADLETIKNSDGRNALDFASDISNEFEDSLLISCEEDDVQNNTAMNVEIIEETDTPKELEEPSTITDKPTTTESTTGEKENSYRAAGAPGGAAVPSDQSFDDSETVIEMSFEKARTLQHLADESIPLQSVFSILNIDEMTVAVSSLVKAGAVETFGKQEIVQLNTSLKISAETLKVLFTKVKKFASLFDEQDKKDVLSNALALQTVIKGLILVVKQLNQKPGDQALRENLQSITKDMLDSVYKFYKSCELASMDNISNNTQTCAESLTKILETCGGDSKDDFDAACKAAAIATLKLTQLVKCKAAQSDAKMKKWLETSAGVTERCTLELINEGRRLWAQGVKPNDDTSNLAKKILLEYRQVNGLLQKSVKETTFSRQEQAAQINKSAGVISEIVQELSEINFSTDLDKALVLQMKLICRKLENLASLDTMEDRLVISLVLEISGALKKIRVGISAMDQKSRDQSLKRRFKIWNESLMVYTLISRLSVSAYHLQLPIEGEMQLSVKVEGIVEQCSDFYQQLIQLRS